MMQNEEHILKKEYKKKDITFIIEASKKRKNRWFASKQWYGAALIIIIWAVLQEIITASTDIVDNIFVNNMSTNLIDGLDELNSKIASLNNSAFAGYQAGQVAVNGVTASNQMYIIMLCMVTGFCYASGVYGAQYFGAKDDKHLRQIVAIKLYVTIGITFLFALLSLPYVTEEVIRFTTHADNKVNFSDIKAGMDNGDIQKILDNEAAKLSNQEGAKYYRIISWSYLIFAINATAISTLRETGRPFYSFFVALIALTTNCVLNVFLTSPHFIKSFDGLGVAGCAIATASSRVLQLLFIVVLLSVKRFEFIPRVESFRIDKHILSKTVIKALPILVNETLYAFGQVMQVKLKAMYSYDALTANAMYETILMAFFSPLYHGVNAGIAVFVGNQLGANKIENARYSAKHLMRLSFIIGLLAGLLLIGMSFTPVLSSIFSGTSTEAQNLAKWFLIIFGITYPIIIINNGSYSMLRAGGSFWSSFIIDAGFNWTIQIPLLTLLIMLNTHVATGPQLFTLDIIAVHAIICSIEVLKIVFSLGIYLKGKWAKNLTNDNVDKKTPDGEQIVHI